MKKLLFTLSLGFLLFNSAFIVRAEDQIPLCQADAYMRMGKYQWLLPISRLEKLPQWKDNKGNPPLSVKKAVSVARKWIATQNASKSTGGEVESILIRPIMPSANESRVGKFRDSYFYQIKFGIYPYGNHITCVVLMDGTALEPQYIKDPEFEGK